MRHLAIIADGNRRWADRHGLPREAGHAQGLQAVENTSLWAADRGIPYLTFFCFSTENWNRDPGEVRDLMDLARRYFTEQREWYLRHGIRVQFHGRRDRLDADLVESMAGLERDTASCPELILTFCVDYGGRDEIARAAEAGAGTEQDFQTRLTAEFPEPDAVLRTGGEMRLSNFLLWQCAYSELFFTPTLFPDLEEGELDCVLREYEGRQRNYGR